MPVPAATRGCGLVFGFTRYDAIRSATSSENLSPCDLANTSQDPSTRPTDEPNSTSLSRMPATKRSHDVANDDSHHVPTLQRVRNMWQFANLVQWIYIFGKAVKIDDSIDVEVIENETLNRSSQILQDVALALVKMASSFRGIASDGLDDQLRKLYRSHAPDSNPFGEDETPTPFDSLDPLIKVRVLQQLTQWIMIHPERFRDKMEEQRDIDQTVWRIEPYGWDDHDRTYFVLDDNRLYRLSEPPAPPPPIKRPKKMKTYRTGRRSSRRQRSSLAQLDDEVAEHERTDVEDDAREGTHSLSGDESLGGMVWECIAVTLGEVETFLDTIAKSRDENEKILRNQIKDHLLPILQKQEDSRKRREQQRERELLNQAKMASAKRSSRIAGKIEQQRNEEEEKKQEEERRRAVLAERKEELERMRRERERDFRMASRENRLKERESRRRLHEEELAQLSEDSRNMSDRPGRLSERRIQADIERTQQALKELEAEEEDWIFDCTCGLYGRIDDGEHSIACERCNVWQHSKCIGINAEEAERQDFHFVCPRCIKLQRNDRPAIKLKVHSSGSRPSSSAGTAQSSIVVEIPAKPPGHISEHEMTAMRNGIHERPADNSGCGGVGTRPGDIDRASTSETSGKPEISSNVGYGKGLPKDASESDALGETTGIQGDGGAEVGQNDTHTSEQTALGLSTPYQGRQNTDPTNGVGPMQLLATPALGGGHLHQPLENSNGLHSSPGGISPTKFSPQVNRATAPSEAARAKLALSPMTSLVPAPIPQDPTPPVKPFDVRSSFSSFDQSLKDE
ncbi:PHD-finger domain-containing protein [Sarocladium implicatum]|nr:PHD-finger domain-containing protein [Sarocladium implicatum]